MQDLRELHAGVSAPEEWKHEANAGRGKKQAPQCDTPEHELLTGVKLARRRIYLRVADETTSALEPFPVQALGKVLPDPKHDHGKDADNERDGEGHVEPCA